VENLRNSAQLDEPYEKFDNQWYSSFFIGRDQWVIDIVGPIFLRGKK